MNSVGPPPWKGLIGDTDEWLGYMRTCSLLKPGCIRRLWQRKTVLGLLLLCLPLSVQAQSEKITLRLATGSQTGIYYPLGHGIKRVIEEVYPEDVNIEVVATSGTLENLELLNNGQTDLALVQNDTAYYFSHGQAMFELPSSKALAVASLYTELIQIIATRKSEINYLKQLKGRRIRTGSPPEKIANSATLLFSQDGWESADLTDVRCSFSDAREMLLNNTLDAAFVTAGTPTPLLTKSIDGIALQDYITFIPIGEGLANRVIRAFPYFVYTEIPANTYNDQTKAVRTIGVRAILVAGRDFELKKSFEGKIPSQFIKTITQAIFENEDLIKNEHGVPGADLSRYDFSLSGALDGIVDHRMDPIIPIHPEAWAYYTEQGLLSRKLSDYLPMLIWFWVGVVLLVYLIKYRFAIRRIAQRHIHIRLTIIFVCLFVLGTLAMFFCERYNNRNFESLGESFWSITIYMLSGFEDRYPVTWLGRLISILIFILSVFFFGAIAGRFAAAFLKKEELAMPQDVKDHIVICNWNERGRRVITELRHPEGKPDADVVIIDDKTLDKESLSRLPSFNKLHYISEDPIRHGTLKKARVVVADTVIVLADGQSPDPDAKSAMIILALLSECKKRRPHIIAEVVNSDNSQHLQDAGADETICTTEIGVGILAHCALNKQLSVVYKDLLTYSFEGNEIYIITRDHFPAEFIGKPFGECAQMLYSRRDKNNPVILLGIRRGDKVIMNPRQDTGGRDAGECVIEEEDALIAMAFMAPDLTK